MNLEGMPVLVVGGAGNIGSHVVDALIQEGAKVTVYDSLARGRPGNLSNARQNQDIRIIDGDVTDRLNLRDACEGIDTVFHLAAMNRAQRSIDDPIRSNLVNVNGTLNCLHKAKESNVSKFVFVSSSSVSEVIISPSLLSAIT